MQKDLDNESPVKSIKTSQKCRYLANLQKKVNVGDKKVYSKKTALYNILNMTERNVGIEELFSFELTTVSYIYLHYGSYDEETPKEWILQQQNLTLT